MFKKIGLHKSLRSDRLFYRKFTSADLEDYQSYISNPEVMKFIGSGPLNGKNAKEKFQVVLDANSSKKLYGFYKAIRKNDNAFVGLVKFDYLEKGKVEIGYALLPDYWGQGLASEMLYAMIEYGNSLKLDELIGLVHPDNLTSKKVLTKTNFEKFQEGLLESYPTEYYKLTLNQS